MKRCLILLALLLGACGGGESSVGTQVHWLLQTTPLDTAPTPAGDKTFDNTEGVPVTLSQAYLVLSSVEITDDCASPSFVLRMLLDGLIGTAQAHTQSSDTRLGEPHVIDLTGDDADSTLLGTLSPPVASYCGGRWQIAAADDDAIGLPDDLDMVGYSLRLRGTYGDTDAAFELDVSLAPLPIERQFSGVLSLDSDHREASVTLSLHYDRWFDGVDMTALAQGDANARDQVLANLRAQLSLEVSRP
ncbi:hypothetical protein [uncultured Abyssibacter sp.]|uniref:hypothetical protein n=1 Tax=uncultured Abyssibacter sp. TaxID=2320202 RepID=UPI0032B0F5F1